MREQRPNKLSARQREALYDRLRARRRTKETLEQIGNDFGVSYQAVCYHAKRLPPSIKFKPARRQVDEGEVLRLYGIHMNQGTVAEILGIPTRTISNMIARMEWKAAA
ncbi:hypothetical protein [Microvirga sp. BSC39]|uniref:hypothetical protein n=1 Tax=Microvirga sp. BSC39 TaxID=1549810 RepID=UPI0004E8CF72|nr:hypothetical protein [Microvirga sp. BSC39]KFG68688.1 hypothetical protein JH26_14530 [Microvirga sp. BSC39]